MELSFLDAAVETELSMHQVLKSFKEYNGVLNKKTPPTGTSRS
jgi:hypothetical protein